MKFDSCYFQSRLLLLSIVISANCFGNNSISIQDSVASEINSKRLTKCIVGGTVLYGGTMIGLNQLWYADFDRTSFHFFNDNDEWMQMDKVGHVATAYHFAKAAKNSLLWAGMDQNKARNYGAAYGLLFQSTLELLDGYSSAWGASAGDIIANTAGVGLMWGQDVLWSEQRINLKYSYTTSEYVTLRPGTFGENLREQFLKDYNGQTYWLSANVSSFISESSRIPKWLNVAAGYGIDGITGARFNPDEFGQFARQRQYYLSLDIDLERIKTKSKALKFIFSTLSFIKIPSPTLEFAGSNSKFHWIFF